MNKSELISEVVVSVNGTGVTKHQTEVVINRAFELIRQKLVAGEEISISDFGKFTVNERAARIGRNPRTGETINIGPTRVAKFKPSSTFFR